jgi:hypothetical protein
MNKNWRKLLYDHYTSPPEKIFPQFKLGAVVFLLGLILIYGGHQLLEPSIQQELITLVGLITIGIGFTVAMMAQIRMLIGRILRFFNEL